MGNLSGLTIGDTTFAVLAATGGGDMPIHVNLPKSASDASPSGLAMLAWPNGMRYVYCTSVPSTSVDTTGFIPPEYMGNGSVHIIDKQQTILTVSRSGSTPFCLNNMTVGQNGNTVIGDSISGAVVTFEAGIDQKTASATSTKSPPAKTSILFFVNPA